MQERAEILANQRQEAKDMECLVLEKYDDGP